jgi:hypothetical protein
MTTLRWNLDDVAEEVDAFDPARAEVVTETQDLGLDFIPVVHVPNTVTSEHFGEATLAYVLEVIDEIVTTETDLAGAAALVGTPPLAVKGRLDSAKSYGPGTVYEMGDNGDARFLDTSHSLDALLGYVAHLTDRLLTNMQLSKSYLGSGDAQQVPSGVALRLMFSLLTNLVQRMRLARQDKYALLFKFAARMAMTTGELEPTTDLPPIELQFGYHLPGEQAIVIEETRQLYNDGLISLATAVRRLKAAGVEIEDVDAEVIALQREDIQAARDIVDATGDVTAARTRLGLSATPTTPFAAPPTA